MVGRQHRHGAEPERRRAFRRHRELERRVQRRLRRVERERKRRPVRCLRDTHRRRKVWRALRGRPYDDAHRGGRRSLHDDPPLVGATRREYDGAAVAEARLPARAGLGLHDTARLADPDVAAQRGRARAAGRAGAFDCGFATATERSPAWRPLRVERHREEAVRHELRGQAGRDVVPRELQVRAEERRLDDAVNR